MKKFIIPALAIILIGCATLNPGADPLVVRTEQALTTANATFDFVLHLDNSDRGFWRTNAPAFHQFCEFLRTPVSYRGTNMARVVVMELNVADLKQDYKFNKTASNSNALFTALLTLNSFLSQSVSWSNIVVTPIHP